MDKIKLTPRQYQKDAFTKICNAHELNQSRIVLAAATGSGKTEMAIMVIDNFIRKKYGRVLVITHHTNVIKDNFVNRLKEIKPDFSYSTTRKNVDVFISIRQNIVKLNMKDYGLIIVDEAHHNYFSSTIQKRIKNIKHQVLLTATPSKFVCKGGYEIIPIGRLDIPNEFFAKLNFICVNSDSRVAYDDLNESGVLLSNYNFKKNEIESAVSSVKPYLKEGKKLFIFRSIKDARKGSIALKNIYGIEAPISDSKSDPNSELVEKFKNNGLDNLCVVDRMRLGYSDDSLYYTIDMTFTHNPDGIYQMMSRSNRGDQSMRKYYIKVTNNKLNEYTRLIVSIALALFKSENIVKYNGKDFKGIRIPILKKQKRKPVKKGDDTREKASDYIIPDVLDDIITFFETDDYVDGDMVIQALLKRDQVNKWTKDRVIKLAYGMQRTKFRNKHHGAYEHAKRGGYLNELNLKGQTIWTRKKVEELADGMNRSLFCKKYHIAYGHAKRGGYLHELNLTGKAYKRWTREEVEVLAKSLQRNTFSKHHPSAFRHAKRYGYYDDLNFLKRA